MAHDNLEDLIALARRGELSQPETRRLEMALKTSDGARALHEVGVAFDRMDTQQGGDEALFERVGRSVAERVATGKRGAGRSRRTRRLLLLAALGLGTSAAAASAVGVRLAKSGAPAIVASSAPVLPAPSTARAARRSPRQAPEVDTSAEPEAATLAGSEEPERDAPAGPRPGSSNPTAPTVALPDASSLFKQANAARKAGESSQALGTYRRLQQSFPNSPEARLSLVLSGRLLLAQGQASRALAAFDGYLAGGGQGGLVEEALWGKAQALSRLGRSSEERQVWRSLLDRYPESVYAPAARRRLQR